MALAAYQALTLALLQAPTSPIPLITTDNLTTYINNARLQVAAQGACIRQYASLALVQGANQYNFSALTGLATGVAGVYHIRQVWYQIPGTTGLVWLPSRPFEYLGMFGLNKPVPQEGAPSMWAQFGQGETGSFFIDPAPDLPYDCKLDALGVPAPLVDDTTAEAIPAIWTLPVPYYAAWFALLSLQRSSDAEAMLKRFQEQMALARNAANPDLLQENWSQSQDPQMANRLGVSPGRAA